VDRNTDEKSKSVQVMQSNWKVIVVIVYIMKYHWGDSEYEHGEQIHYYGALLVWFWAWFMKAIPYSRSLVVALDYREDLASVARVTENCR